MEFSDKKKLIYWYLDKNYNIYENRYFTKDGNHEWGFEIANLLSNVFSVDKNDCVQIFTQWSYEHDLDKEGLEFAWDRRVLKTSWSPEITQDLGLHYCIISAEERLINSLIEELTAEIGSQILRDLKGEIKNSDDFLSVVKCLGYEQSLTTYNPNTLFPIKRFISIKYDEMLIERQNNSFWLNYEKK